MRQTTSRRCVGLSSIRTCTGEATSKPEDLFREIDIYRRQRLLQDKGCLIAKHGPMRVVEAGQ